MTFQTTDYAGLGCVQCIYTSDIVSIGKLHFTCPQVDLVGTNTPSPGPDEQSVEPANWTAPSSINMLPASNLLGQ